MRKVVGLVGLFLASVSAARLDGTRSPDHWHPALSQPDAPRLDSIPEPPADDGPGEKRFLNMKDVVSMLQFPGLGKKSRITELDELNFQVKPPNATNETRYNTTLQPEAPPPPLLRCCGTKEEATGEYRIMKFIREALRDIKVELNSKVDSMPAKLAERVDGMQIQLSDIRRIVEREQNHSTHVYYPPENPELTRKVDGVEARLAEIQKKVAPLGMGKEVARSTQGEVAGGDGQPKSLQGDYGGGYQDGFRDGYSHGFHEGQQKNPIAGKEFAPEKRAPIQDYSEFQARLVDRFEGRGYKNPNVPDYNSLDGPKTTSPTTQPPTTEKQPKLGSDQEEQKLRKDAAVETAQGGLGRKAPPKQASDVAASFLNGARQGQPKKENIPLLGGQ